MLLREWFQSQPTAYYRLDIRLLITSSQPKCWPLFLGNKLSQVPWQPKQTAPTVPRPWPWGPRWGRRIHWWSLPGGRMLEPRGGRPQRCSMRWKKNSNSLKPNRNEDCTVEIQLRVTRTQDFILNFGSYQYNYMSSFDNSLQQSYCKSCQQATLAHSSSNLRTECNKLCVKCSLLFFRVLL